VVIHEAWGNDDSDVREHRYRLTPGGRAVLEQVPEELVRSAKEMVKRVQELEAWKQGPLAIATKLHHIREIEPKANLKNAPELARQFGWQIPATDAVLGAKLLSSLGIA
jgi:hypothetical protein